MNIFLLEQDDFVSEEIAVIRGRRFEHARDILNVRVGDELKAGLLNGMLGTIKVLDRTQDAVRVQACWTEEPPRKHDVTVLLALPRPPVARRLIAVLTAMGVSRIVFMQTARVEKSYWSSPVLKIENLEATIKLGLEQARDTVMPSVCFEKNFKALVRDRLPELTRGRRALLAHPYEADRCPCSVQDPVVLAIGPEGGFLDEEARMFCECGFEPVTLGPRILRVETAVQAMVGRVVLVD